MCKHGTLKEINLNKPDLKHKSVLVDACIADEIQKMNDLGIVTLSCCCGHGSAGMPTEWENGTGKWKGYYQPPHVLIKEESIEKSKQYGYRPFPYYYADGESYGVWQMYLKTGCITEKDCDEWEKMQLK